MATFTYQYRNATGSVKSGTVEAASRAEAFEMLKAQGVNPLHIDSSKTNMLATRRHVSFWSVAVAICAIACVVGGIFLLRQSGHDGAKPSALKPVEHAQPKKKALVERPQSPIATPEPSAVAAVPERVEPTAVSNTINTIVSAPTNEIFRAPSLSKRTVTLMDGTTAELTSRQIFGRDKPLDLQLMAVTKPGGMAGGLRALRVRFSDDEIIAMLKQPVVYDKNDPDDVKDIKMRVQRQKDIVLDFLKQGGTVTDAIDQMCQSAGKERIEMRNDHIMLNELIKAGDSEAIRKFLKERNTSRRELGLPELSLPSQYQLPPEEKNK